MANISAIQNINSGDAVLASVVSNNFSQVLVAVNSNALNSDNYGQSSILSQHVSTGAILSQHISNSQVNEAKISDSAVVHAKMNFASTDSGVRVVQIGDEASDMPAGGVIGGRLTQTLVLSTDANYSVTHTFADCADGDPAFTAAPVLCGVPIWQFGATSDFGPRRTMISAIDANSVVMIYGFTATQDGVSATVHLGVEGPK